MSFMGIGEEDKVYVFNGTLFHYKVKNHTIHSNMDRSEQYCAKWSKSERKIPWSHEILESKKKNKTSNTRWKQTDSYREWVWWPKWGGWKE